jgi:hypothetical protein
VEEAESVLGVGRKGTSEGTALLQVSAVLGAESRDICRPIVLCEPAMRAA